MSVKGRRRDTPFEKVKDEEVARRLLVGQDVKAIAAELNVRSEAISRRINTPEFAAVLELVKKGAYEDVDKWIKEDKMSITQKLEFGSGKALAKLYELMERAENEKNQLDAARDWLDRAGYARAVKIGIGRAEPDDKQMAALEEALKNVDKTDGGEASGNQ